MDLQTKKRYYHNLAEGEILDPKESLEFYEALKHAVIAAVHFSEEDGGQNLRKHIHALEILRNFFLTGYLIHLYQMTDGEKERKENIRQLTQRKVE